MKNAQALQKMQETFLLFSKQAIGSPMYQSLSKQISEDAELLSLSSLADQNQPVPNLFFAAVNFLLYKNPSSVLSRYYPNHSGNPYSEHELFTNFKLFSLENRDQIVDIMNSRLVQTNEVRRCAILMPAVSKVPDEIALIDVGTSSGLNLLMDKYSYQYSDGTLLGKTESELKLFCLVKKGNLKSIVLPRISRRIGIDLNPINLNDPDELLWTISLVWPDQIERIDRLKSAIQILKNNPVQLFKEDANIMLPPIVKDLPAHLNICIMHSFALNQFPSEARIIFESLLCDLSMTREIWRVSLEWLSGDYPQLKLEHFKAGQKFNSTVLAEGHHHGEWISV